MLVITEEARAIVKAILEDRDCGPHTGLRIAESSHSPLALSVELMDGPVAGDQVIDGDGVRLYLAPAAAADIDGRVLDAAVQGGSVTFSLSSPEEVG